MVYLDQNRSEKFDIRIAADGSNQWSQWLVWCGVVPLVPLVPHGAL
jgi:hypothetical protein